MKQKFIFPSQQPYDKIHKTLPVPMLSGPDGY